MTIYVDTSALVRRYAHDRDRALVVDAMTADADWCASALARTETQLALQQVAISSGQAAALWRRLRDDWEAFVVVPVDDRCLARATELGATYGLRTVDAVHLAAADRLPKPLTYLTLDRRQLAPALGLGFDVLAPE